MVLGENSLGRVDQIALLKDFIHQQQLQPIRNPLLFEGDQIELGALPRTVFFKAAYTRLKEIYTKQKYTQEQQARAASGFAAEMFERVAVSYLQRQSADELILGSELTFQLFCKLLGAEANDIGEFPIQGKKGIADRSVPDALRIGLTPGPHLLSIIEITLSTDLKEVRHKYKKDIPLAENAEIFKNIPIEVVVPQNCRIAFSEEENVIVTHVPVGAEAFGSAIDQFINYFKPLDSNKSLKDRQQQSAARNSQHHKRRSY